jgi:hypothetical protein
MAREYPQIQIDFGPTCWQAHVYTQLNDLSEIDSWTVLILRQGLGVLKGRDAVKFHHENPAVDAGISWY